MAHAESNALPIFMNPGADELVNSLKGAPANEKDAVRIDLDELLLRVLSPTLGRHVGDVALDDFQEGLLNALAGRHLA